MRSSIARAGALGGRRVRPGYRPRRAAPARAASQGAPAPGDRPDFGLRAGPGLGCGAGDQRNGLRRGMDRLRQALPYFEKELFDFIDGMKLVESEPGASRHS